METRGGKILEFLKENSHLDLEVPDIAFNVKKSEKTVEAALQKYQQKGLVTARQNEYGRVYWYALPSAPITKSFQIEGAPLPKENPVSRPDNKSDEVDLSELKAEPAPPVKKGRKNAAAPPIKQKEEAAPQAAPAQPAPSTRPTTTIKQVAAVKQEMAPVPKDAPETVKFEPVSFEASEPLPKSLPAEPEKNDEPVPVSAASRVPSVSPILITIILVALISLIALLRSGGLSAKIKKLETASKEFVTVNDFKTVKEQAVKIGELETKIAVVIAQVDSLKKVVDQAAAAAQSKPAAAKGFYQKRKTK